MSETAAAPVFVPPAGGVVDKRAWAQTVLTDLLRLLEIPSRLEFKDAPDNGIAVAIFPETDVPGLQAGKRSSVVEALQFLSNKIVNRPNTERRWISLGVGGFPEPRQPPPPPAPAAVVPPARAAAPKPAVQAAPPPLLDETSAQVPPDVDVSRLGRLLAEKSAQFGRFMAVAAMPFSDRVNLYQGAKDVKGQTVRLEGEGRNRRVVFSPEKPVPMPKRALPLDDEDDLEE